MGTVVVCNSVAKRVIVTLMPAISFLCMFGLAAISVNFLEYGSTADRIVEYIGVSCIIPMIVSIPFIFKVNREKTVLDINTFYVTPFVGRTKNIPVQDVKVCTIGRRKKIRLFDEKSNLICKYKSTQDKEQIILKTLQKAGTCTFTFSVRNGEFLPIILQREKFPRQSIAINRYTTCHRPPLYRTKSRSRTVSSTRI